MSEVSYGWLWRVYLLALQKTVDPVIRKWLEMKVMISPAVST